MKTYGVLKHLQLKHKGSGWTFNPLYSFSSGGLDGAIPWAGMIIGPDGNLYGTTAGGGSDGDGTVFMLRPPPHACTTALCPWAETVLYYGTTSNIATAVELSPSDGTWTYSLLYTFGSFDLQCGPRDTLVMDGAGSLYGTTYCTVPNGTVFKLTPSNDGTWTYTLLHRFEGPGGEFPGGSVVIDTNGNLYGTTFQGGPYGYGVVWEITP